MSKKSLYILTGILGLVVLLPLLRFVFFKEQVDEWGEGLQRIEDWQEQYKRENPDATEAEMDAAFRAGIESLEEWKRQYKEEHPEATDAEVNAAFEALWE